MADVTKDSMERVAYHEAGHVAAAVMAGAIVQAVTLGDSKGVGAHATVLELWPSNCEGINRPLFERGCFTMVSGLAAEAAWLERNGKQGDQKTLLTSQAKDHRDLGDKFAHVNYQYRDLAFEFFLRMQVAMVFLTDPRTWAQIESLAQDLLIRHSLSGIEATNHIANPGKLDILPFVVDKVREQINLQMTTPNVYGLRNKS